jgi:glyoxylase-like metal-dependent hydrolase (beta-lactamase superfamily II)
VVVTHAHSDHVTGAPAIHERWPAAIFSKHPWPIRDPQLPWRRLDDGAIVTTDEGDLTVLHTPGHAPDHLTLWHPDSRTLFVGDMLVQGSTVVIPASQGGSLSEYLKSLERMLRLNPALALPAHGPVIEDPAALIHHYFEHRAQREQQVLSALSAGLTTVDAITAKIYPKISIDLLAMARESVLAHLQKLETERHVTNDGDYWTLITALP